MAIEYTYIKIFENLLRSREGLQVYTLHRRYKLTPSKAVDFINTYAPQGIISVENGTTIYLTSKGRVNFRQIIGDLFKKVDSTENTFLARHIFVPMDKYAPYIPFRTIPFDVKNNDFLTSKTSDEVRVL